MDLKDEIKREEDGLKDLDNVIQIQDLRERVSALLKKQQQLSYSVGALQVDAAKRRRLNQDLGVLLFGVYIGVAVMYIVVRYL